MNTNELKDFAKKVYENVAPRLKAVGVTVDNLNENARAMSLQPGMVLHPQCAKIEDIQIGDPIEGVDATGKKVVNGFAFIPTAEGLRLTESQISRLGNGLALDGKTKVERFASFVDLCINHPDTLEVKVETKYQNTLSNGQTQGLPVFSMKF